MFKNLNLGALGFRAAFFETVELAAATGFQGVDLDVYEMENVLKTKSVEEIKTLLVQRKLRFGGWGLPVNFRGDDEVFQKELERLPMQAQMASSLGCFRVFTWIMPFSDTLPYKENFELHVERLGAVAEILGKYGCVLGLEFVGPKTSRINHKYEFIHTMEEIFELRDAMGAKNVGLLLDCWHWYTSHGTIAQLEQLKDKDVVYVHVNDAPPGIAVDEQIDSVRRLPGETGVIDIAGFLNAMKQIGYDGPVTPEPFDKKLKELPVETAVKTVSEALDKVWKKAGL
ncbi:sugar phosphate isomerase/epimerase [Candidatus Bathyarchaeota archaeon]|nr:MAG: sugar phosphate isomerase/epimerase [Candidatus Bathyarchaeota archaeon]